MQITVNNKNFKRLFLDQIVNIAESAVISVKEDSLVCTNSSSDNSIILNVEFKVDEVKDYIGGVKLNVGDLKKLSRAFDCINKDSLTFSIKNNNINYTDNTVNFKYHLLEDGIILPPKINIEKLKNLDYDCTFTINSNVFSELIKGSTFATDSNKIYLNSKDNTLKGNLTDKTKHNIDSFEVVVSENYNGGKLTDFCINFEVIRILSTLKTNEISCKICSRLGVALFYFENNIIKIKFINSALTK